jgi:MinD superfamily P-loop ATPase
MPGRLPGDGTAAIAVASGKGGTGKTTVAVNLAVAAARAGASTVLVDADVEEPDDHLFLGIPRPSHSDVEVRFAQVREEACRTCGSCRDVCRFGALRMLGGRPVVFPELCRGCGACEVACPSGAMGHAVRRVGEVVSGEVEPLLVRAEEAGSLDLVSGMLDPGEVRAPQVVHAASALAEGRHRCLRIVDASPGVSCATVAALEGVDLLLLVTEPTAFGLHDLALAREMGARLEIPMAVVVNRARPDSEDVGAFCEKNGLPLLSEIPFDSRAAAIHACGYLLLDRHPLGQEWFDTLCERLGELLVLSERVPR